MHIKHAAESTYSMFTNIYNVNKFARRGNENLYTNYYCISCVNNDLSCFK